MWTAPNDLNGLFQGLGATLVSSNDLNGLFQGLGGTLVCSNGVESVAGYYGKAMLSQQSCVLLAFYILLF